MQTKLTVRIDESLISLGKKWSNEHGVSLSALFSQYLETIERFFNESPPPTPILRKLKGVLNEKRTPNRKEYAEFLEKKYR